MRINECDVKASVTLFADGADGYYRQEYILLTPSKEVLGITMITEGRKGERPSRAFVVKGETFTDVEQAFMAAGHVLLREEQ